MTLPTSHKFDQIYRSLLVADVRQHLASFFPSHGFPEEEDLAYVLSVATRLALSGGGDTVENAHAGRRAYEVAIRCLNFANGSTPAVRAVCDLVLSRIGNFPARQLLRGQTERSSAVNDPFLGLEMLVREYENKLHGTGADTVLTDFQVRLIHALEANRSVSVSAPTSAGKSFTLEIELLRRLKDEQSYVAAFLVPTRALIRQVTFDLVGMLRDNDLNSVPVLSAPTVPENIADTHKLIYILTPERLATLLASDDSRLTIDAIMVDEAHEIGESNRGQTLERVLAAMLIRFPKARLFFSSPLRSNPELLLRLFGREEHGEHFIEHLSPVTQNIINIRKVSHKVKTASMELAIENEVMPLGTVELPFAFRGSYMGKFAFHFTNPTDTSIIYCNEPSAADKVALEIAEEVQNEIDDTDLSDLASFLRQEVHSQYRLASLVRKGVAFHYGNIPQIIRGRLEELLRDRKLRFVCCTSTLLQGMNLPAKNIFVEDPKKGRGAPMKKGDFWNLVGRAGRLSKEFHGNVFCIYGKKWDRDVTSDRLAVIESAFEVALKERTAELLQVVKEPPQSAESRELSWAEQTYARIYSDFVSSGKRLADTLDRKTKSEFAEIDSFSEKFKKTLPDTIFLNNFYVHPSRLESVASFLRGTPDLRSWLPVYPSAEGSYQRLVAIFELIEQLLVRSQTQAFRYHAYLANQWMRGNSLRELVANKIARSGAEGVDEINATIRELFRDLEEELRYKYVKYARLYCDVLHAVLSERGLVKEAEALLPIYLFLEYGAANQTLINLMAIGLSRTSALLFKSFLTLRDDLSASDCQGHVNRVNVERSNLPALCKAEINRLRRTRL
ncbi:MAG TPA: DEAD/DEAH box helicase [Candidatus Acidoferrales bacterium]|nr:DEAD/DEAH box helicase [Candidatus Acidoferrales bacterium]